MTQDIAPPERSDSPLPTAPCPLPTAHCQLPTVSWPRWLLLAYVGFLLLALVSVIWVCIRADEAGQICLGAFTPLIQRIVGAGQWLTRDPTHRASILGWALFAAIGLLAVGGLVKRKREGIRPALVLTAVGVAVLGQAAFFATAVLGGCILYALSTLLMVVCRFLPRSLGPGLGDLFSSSSPSQATIEPSPKQTTLVVLEAFCLALITAASILYYFYALNQLPPDFEGEMAIYMAVSTSLDGLLRMNFGAPGLPWSPLGLFYFLLLHAAERTCGTTLLAARFVSAVVGVVLVNLFYGFLRRLGGVTVAVIGTALLASSSLAIVWGRQDFFPFFYPSLVVVALCWTTYRAVETERFRFFLLSALLMGATYHLFPSGQTAFLIPLGVMAWHLVVTGGFARRCWWKMSGIALGVALWLIGLPLCCYLATSSWRWLSPFALNRGKTLWSLDVAEGGLLERAHFTAQSIWHNILGFLECLFVGNIWPTHQTPLHGIPDHPATYIPAVAAVFLAMGTVALLLSPRRKVSSLLLCWIAVASLPGILSTEAAARRLATIFPALFAVSALAATACLTAIQFLYGKRFGAVFRLTAAASAVATLLVLHGSYYFRQPPMPPPSVNMARAMEPYLKPGTLVVADIHHAYYTAAELTYLMLDKLNQGDDPPTWYLPKPADWPDLAIWPRADLDAWYYQYTFLKERLPALQPKPEWERIAYVIHDVPENRRKIEMLEGLSPESSFAAERHTPAHPWYDFLVLEKDAESVKRLWTPEAQVTGKPESLPDSPKGWWEPVEVKFLTATSAAAPETPELALSAALRVKEQTWESFRTVGGGKLVEILLDGFSLEQGQIVPLAGGFHRIDIRFGPPWSFPMSLLSRTESDENYKLVSSARLAAPEVSLIPGLAAQVAVPYSGFHPPECAARIEKGFGADFAVSPSGKIAVAGVFADSWRIQVFGADGAAVAEWSNPIPVEARRRGCLLAFVGQERIAVLDWRWPKIPVYDLAGQITAQINAPPLMDQPLDIGGNQNGDVFVPAGANHFLLQFSLAGELLGQLVPPGDRMPRPWNPSKVSVPWEGPVAVLESLGNIHVFDADGPFSGRRRWARMIEPHTETGWPMFQIRQDGWIFMRYPHEGEFRVLDDQGRRRIATQPKHDLSRILTNNCNEIVGFDRDGNLYVWHEAAREVLRLAPR